MDSCKRRTTVVRGGARKTCEQIIWKTRKRKYKTENYGQLLLNYGLAMGLV